jgi:transposase-like protein
MQNNEISKRNYFSKGHKLKILEDLQSSELTLTLFARKLGIHPVTLHKWKREMKESDKNEHIDNDEIISENEKLKRENENLKKALANLAIDNEILNTANDVLKKVCPKKSRDHRKGN